MVVMIAHGVVALLAGIASFIFPGLVLSKKQREVIEMRRQNTKAFVLFGRISCFLFSAASFALGACMHFLPEYETLWIVLDSALWIGFFVAALVRNKVFLGGFTNVG